MKKVKLIFLALFFAPFLIGQNPQDSKHCKNPKKLAKEKIEGYRQRVIKGEKMKGLAILYSEDLGSAKNGGMYYGVKKGVMDPSFESVAFSLKQGQISQVFETQYGYHFIQLVQRRGEVLDLRHILIIPK